MNNEFNNRGVDVPQNKNKKISAHSIAVFALSAAAVLIILCLEGILYMLMPKLGILGMIEFLISFLYIAMFVVLAFAITAFIMGLADSSRLSRAAGIGSLIFCVGVVLTNVLLIKLIEDIKLFNIYCVAISLNVFLALTMLGILTIVMRKGDNRKIPVGVALLCLGGFQVFTMFGYLSATLSLMSLLFSL